MPKNRFYYGTILVISLVMEVYQVNKIAQGYTDFLTSFWVVFNIFWISKCVSVLTNWNQSKEE